MFLPQLTGMDCMRFCIILCRYVVYNSIVHYYAYIGVPVCFMYVCGCVMQSPCSLHVGSIDHLIN